MACMCFGAAASIFFMASSLSPNDPAVASTLARLAEAYMGLGDFENAVEHAERAMTKQTRGVWINTALVASRAHVGRIEDAKSGLRELLERFPYITCAYLREHLPITDPHLLDVYIDGLRIAGVPEE